VLRQVEVTLAVGKTTPQAYDFVSVMTHDGRNLPS